MKDRATLGVIGGSGVYDIEGLKDRREVELVTPWGVPSDHIQLGRLGETEVAFLPRHGRHHIHTPTEVPFRANLYAMRLLGVQRILSVSAVGSLTEAYAPGDFVLVDQFIDRTNLRKQTFFGDGLVAHLPMAQPIDAKMADVVEQQAQGMDELTMHRGGTYVTIEGPQFSTLAESELYRSWGAKVIGMTNGTEAKLAREAGMSFCTIAMVTDYDCWHPHEGDVDVEKILGIARHNAEVVKQLLARCIEPLAQLGPSPCRELLRNSVLTPPEQIGSKARNRTRALFED